MKNLKLVQSLCLEEFSDELCGSVGLTVDSDRHHIYIASELAIVAIDPQNRQIINERPLSACGFSEDDQVLDLQFLADQNALCIISKHGDIVVWHIAQDEIETVGSVEHGLVSMAWSPDYQLVLFATGAQTLLLMTCEFDPLNEIPIESKEATETENVNVGWGTKQTQFHGSEGKQAAFNAPQVVQPAFDWDDKQVMLSWRGDGDFFTASYINSENGNREIRVWSRECKLHSKSEPLTGLEQPLDWRPSGNLIATCQQHANKHQVIFLEKNGLQHGGFTLPFAIKTQKVVSLQWNLSSNVLCLWSEDISTESSKDTQSRVQLWTTGNYHWYLKQELCFSHATHTAVRCVRWDPEQAYCMHILCANGRYMQYVWSWDVCTADEIYTDHAQVTVVDGAQLLVTPFEHVVVPPPLSAYTISTPHNVCQVSPCFQGGGHLAALLSDNSIHLYLLTENEASDCVTAGVGGSTGTNINGRTHTQSYTYRLTNDLVRCPLAICHMTWVTMDTLVFCTPAVDQSASVICIAKLQNDNKDVQQLSVIHSVPCNKHVKCLCVSVSCDQVLVELNDGAVFTLNLDEGTMSPYLLPDGSAFVFLQPCSKISLVSMGSENDQHQVLLGLTDYYRLYANRLEIANNCTSYVVHNDYVLITTHSHTCRFIKRSLTAKELSRVTPTSEDSSTRNLERGSVAVCVVGGGTKLVLQMPRGNLEVIHPRCLVLAALKRLLDKLLYGEAFLMMKRHRINMNLLYDHNPAAFLDNIDLIITQIHDVHHINIFITDISECDVRSTMYDFAYNQSTLEVTNSSACKVDVVCDALRCAMERLDANRYMLCIITALVHKKTPDLENALLKVKTVTDEVTGKNALKHLIFLVDVNKLYDVALGTYDFDLVMMVAEKSQKDPKEYLPLLNELKKLEQNYQRYRIDIHLKRYEKALRHLSLCGAEHFDTALSLIKEQRLYSAGMKFWTTSTAEYKRIACSYGDFLSSKGYKREAGLMYNKAQAWQQCAHAYTDCREWQQALCALLRIMDNTDHKIAVWARNMAAKLADHRQHKEAALLLHQYAQDDEQAITVLIEGCEWSEALRVMYSCGRTDFIESDLRTAMLDTCASHIEWVDATHADLTRYTDRLQTVRKQKQDEKLELAHDQGVAGRHMVDSDLYSDASSATGVSLTSGTESSRSTIFTKASGRTAKSRKKATKKKWSLKQGSRFEDLALVETIANIVKQVEQYTADISSLLHAMVEFHYEERCQTLQDKLHALRGCIATTIPVVWSEAALAEKSTNFPTAFGPSVTANMLAQSVQAEEQDDNIDPILRNVPAFNKDYKWRLHCLTNS